jgi:hypothetical protein
LPTRVEHDELVDPLIKRIEIPEIAPDDPVPITGPKPNPDPAIPGAQDPHPVVITPAPKVTEEPAPTQKPTETGATVTDATPTETDITTVTDEAQLCARSADGLWSRSDCDPGSGDTNPDAGGFDSEPQNVDVQPAAGEAPAIDRTQVKNWFNVIETHPKPQFKALEDFNRRIGTNEPDRPIADLEGKYNVRVLEHAGSLFQDTREELQTMWTKLETFGKTDDSLPTGGRSVIVKSVAGGRHASKVVLEATISNDGRIIVADFSEKANDLTPKDQQIPWDRLVFSLYKDVMDLRNGGNLRNLKSIGRYQIGNAATKNTIETALKLVRKTTKDSSEVVTFSANAPAGSVEAHAFEALLRNDNANGVIWKLSDYHQLLGDKRITQISVARDGISFDLVIDVA